jgi:hypothetical protein
MPVRRWLFFVSVLAGVVTGCTPTSSGAHDGGATDLASGDGGGGDGRLSEALAGLRAMTTAYCGWMARCGLIAQSQADDCASGIIRDYAHPPLLPQHSSFVVSGVEACVRAFDTRVCAEGFWVSDLPPECHLLLNSARAAVTTGGPCGFSSYECASPLDSCTGMTCPRTCQTVPRGGAGQPCRRDAESEAECDSGLFCNDLLLCEPRKPPGAPCRDRRTSECLSGYCDAILEATGKCLAGSDAGTACGSPGCTEGTFCGEGSICTPVKGADQACRVGSSDECALPLWCNGGFCRQRGSVGAACRTESACASPTHCDSVLRSCQEYTTVATGAQCTDDTRSCIPPARCVGERSNSDGGVGTLQA